jgi:hypothetical protein
MTDSVQKRQCLAQHELDLMKLLPIIGRDMCSLLHAKLTAYDLKLVHAAVTDCLFLPELYASRDFQASCARHGYLSLLKQVGTIGWPQDIAPNAARSGHLPVLQWLKDRGMPHLSIGHGFLTDDQCDGDECHACGRTCGNAAENGHLHILQWAKTHWPSLMRGVAFIYGYAAVGGRLDVLQWLFDNGYPCKSIIISKLAIHYNDIPALQWLSAHGCEVPSGALPILSNLGTHG